MTLKTCRGERKQVNTEEKKDETNWLAIDLRQKRTKM
jgi:hypothetical protein